MTSFVKEEEVYATVSEKIAFLNLEDNSDRDSVRQQFPGKVGLLEKAQEEKEYQAERKRQMREEKSVRMNLTGASGKRKSLAEQQKLIEEALRAAEGAHREELEKQRLALEQKIQEAHAQYECANHGLSLRNRGMFISFRILVRLVRMSLKLA